MVITVGILLDNEGKNWNGTGLTPDVDASLTNDEQSSYYDLLSITTPRSPSYQCHFRRQWPSKRAGETQPEIYPKHSIRRNGVPAPCQT